MIIQSDLDLEPGTVYSDSITDEQINVHRQPVYIVRRATLEEWIAHARKHGVPEYHIRMAEQFPMPFFYEISTD